MDVEKTVDILNAITVGLMRVVELVFPLMLLLCMGTFKVLVSAFAGTNAYRKTGSKKQLLTDLDEI